MKNKILGGAALLMAAFSLNEVNATSCTAAPTCAQLGYTMKKADCGDYPVMRCPFALTDDNQVFCEGTVKVAELPILYGDGTVSKKLISGKTPIGVVFDETNKLALALTNVGGKNLPLSVNKDYDIPNLENCEMADGYDSTVINCAVDGRANTNKILACGSGCGGTPAATACNDYQPSGCSKDFCKKTKWFLPSMRDLNNIYQQKGAINSTLTFLSSLGGQILTEGYYWSSTERYSSSAWYIQMSNGFKIDLYKNAMNFIRPVVAF